MLLSDCAGGQAVGAAGAPRTRTGWFTGGAPALGWGAGGRCSSGHRLAIRWHQLFHRGFKRGCLLSPRGPTGASRPTWLPRQRSRWQREERGRLRVTAVLSGRSSGPPPRRGRGTPAGRQEQAPAPRKAVCRPAGDRGELGSLCPLQNAGQTPHLVAPVRFSTLECRTAVGLWSKQRLRKSWGYWMIRSSTLVHGGRRLRVWYPMPRPRRGGSARRFDRHSRVACCRGDC